MDKKKTKIQEIEEEEEERRTQLKAKLLKIKLAGIGPVTPEARRGLIQDTKNPSATIHGSNTQTQNRLRQEGQFINKNKKIRPKGPDAKINPDFKKRLAKIKTALETPDEESKRRLNIISSDQQTNPNSPKRNIPTNRGIVKVNENGKIRPPKPKRKDFKSIISAKMAHDHGHTILMKSHSKGVYRSASLESQQGHYAKYWLLNAKETNGNGWGIASHSAKENMRKFIGRPLVVTSSTWHGDKVAGRYGKSYDHPYVPTNDLNKIFEHQEQYRVGNIVDVGEKNGDYYAMIEMLPKFANMTLPPFCSPAIYQLDAKEAEGQISKWEALHLAALDENPAYGARIALLKGTCVGTNNECRVQFRSAKQKEASIVCTKAVKSKLANIFETSKKLGTMKEMGKRMNEFEKTLGTEQGHENFKHQTEKDLKTESGEVKSHLLQGTKINPTGSKINTPLKKKLAKIKIAVRKVGFVNTPEDKKLKRDTGKPSTFMPGTKPTDRELTHNMRRQSEFNSMFPQNPNSSFDKTPPFIQNREKSDLKNNESLGNKADPRRRLNDPALLRKRIKKLQSKPFVNKFASLKKKQKVAITPSRDEFLGEHLVKRRKELVDLISKGPAVNPRRTKTLLQDDVKHKPITLFTNKRNNKSIVKKDAERRRNLLITDSKLPGQGAFGDPPDTLLLESNKIQDHEFNLSPEGKKERLTRGQLTKYTPNPNKGTSLAKLKLKLASLGQENMTFQNSKKIKILKKKHPEVRKAKSEFKHPNIDSALRKIHSSIMPEKQSSFLSQKGDFIGGGDDHTDTIKSIFNTQYSQEDKGNDGPVTRFSTEHGLPRIQRRMLRSGERVSVGIHSKINSSQLRALKDIEKSGIDLGFVVGADPNTGETGDGFRDMTKALRENKFL